MMLSARDHPPVLTSCFLLQFYNGVLYFVHKDPFHEKLSTGDVYLILGLLKIDSSLYK
jgi:hypothetical protein